MAGIWNRIIPGDDRLSSHLLHAALYLRVSGDVSAATLLAKLNSTVVTPLDSAAETDLANMVTAASTGSATAKIDYQLKFNAWLIAVEAGLLTNEATFRSKLGIA